MKKAILIFLAVMCLFTLVLGGCSSEKAGNGSNTGADIGNTAADDDTAKETKTDNTPKGKISFMCWYNEQQYAPILDAFKAKYPDVEIEFQNTPSENDQYAQKLTLLANSGELPDVFYNSLSVKLHAKYGYFLDITDLPEVQRLSEGNKAINSYEGRVYSFAPDGWIAGIYYNKDLFAKNSLSEPKTYSEFLNMCKVFQDQGIKPISMAMGELPDLVFLLHNTEVLSKDPLSDDKINTGESTFSAEYTTPLNMWYNDFVKTGIVSQDMAGMSDDQRFDEFCTGKAAMTISGPWALSTFRQKNPDLNFAIMPFPGTNGDLWTLGCPNVGIAISAKSDNLDAAKALLQFIGSDEGLAIYQKINNMFIGVEGINYSLDPVLEPMKKFMENGKFQFPVAVWDYASVIAPMLEKGMQEIVLDVTTPEKVAQDIDAKIADLINK